MQNKMLMVFVALIAGALAWAVFVWQPGQKSTQPAHEPLPLAKPPTGGDFNLEGPEGPVALKDYRGKVVLLFFGYTHCPDICPTSLSVTAQALTALDESEQKQVQVLFVSVDPERDTMDKLKDYAAYFHPKILGITGKPDELAAAAALYGASYAKQEPDDKGAYAVAHSAYTYLIDRNGRLVSSIDYGTPAPQLLAEVRKVLLQHLPAPPSPPTPAAQN